MNKNGDYENLYNYCNNKLGAYETRPFGEYPICFKVAGKIFTQILMNANDNRITLKTSPEKAEIYRSMYWGVVVRGYHCPPVQQPHWNTIYLDGEGITEQIIYNMIDEAYELVVSKLTKKARARIESLQDIHFVNVDGSTSGDFSEVCRLLDIDLDELVGNAFDRSQYIKYNQTANIHDVVLVYDGENLVGGGGFKFYDEESAELKRVFIKKEYRGRGLSRELLYRIEALAKIKGYRYMLLESGELLVDAMALYRRAGYKEISNYGQYIDMTDSICMSKKL